MAAATGQRSPQGHNARSSGPRARPHTGEPPAARHKDGPPLSVATLRERGTTLRNVGCERSREDLRTVRVGARRGEGPSVPTSHRRRVAAKVRACRMGLQLSGGVDAPSRAKSGAGPGGRRRAPAPGSGRESDRRRAASSARTTGPALGSGESRHRRYRPRALQATSQRSCARTPTLAAGPLPRRRARGAYVSRPISRCSFPQRAQTTTNRIWPGMSSLACTSC
jgi:hypothetical protein